MDSHCLHTRKLVCYVPYNYIDDNYISQRMMGHQRLRKDLYCILDNVYNIIFFYFIKIYCQEVIKYHRNIHKPKHTNYLNNTI